MGLHHCAPPALQYQMAPALGSPDRQKDMAAGGLSNRLRVSFCWCCKGAPLQGGNLRWEEEPAARNKAGRAMAGEGGAEQLSPRGEGWEGLMLQMRVHGSEDARGLHKSGCLGLLCHTGMRGWGMHRGMGAGGRRGQNGLSIATEPGSIHQQFSHGLCLGLSKENMARAALLRPPSPLQACPNHPSLPSCLVPGELSIPQAPPDHCPSVTSLLVAMEKPGCPKHDPLASSHVCQEMKGL